MAMINTNLASNPSVISPEVDTYTLFLVCPLPAPHEIANSAGKLTVTAQDFIQRCLHNAKQRNFVNLHDGSQHSGDYFTDLNHSERYRIPTSLSRLNPNPATERFGILSFWVYKDEPVKNKVYNQRISSVNPNVIVLERIKELFYPRNYRMEQMIDLHPLGELQEVVQQDFNKVKIDHRLLVT